jgi:hypothetical protein
MNIYLVHVSHAMSLNRFDPQNFAPKLLDSTIVPSPNMILFLGVSKLPSLHLHTHLTHIGSVCVMC